MPTTWISVDPSTAVVPTLATMNNELDVLPLEFLDLPELTEETLNATHENSEQIFCVSGARDIGCLGILWDANEGEN